MVTCCMRQKDCGQRALDHPINEGNGVIAASTDPTDKADEAVCSQSLTFPVGYGLHVGRTAASLGALDEERWGILPSTRYVLRPDGTLAATQYSSSPIGRLVWHDLLGLVQHYNKPST
jgi:hypothetical protein